MINRKTDGIYKYYSKIGGYEANCITSIRMFKINFGKEYIYEIKKIKWLSNFELEMLMDELMLFLAITNKKNDVDSLEDCKERILKLLR